VSCQQACGTSTVYSYSSTCSGGDSISLTNCVNLDECVSLYTSTGQTFYQKYTTNGFEVYSDENCNTLLASESYGGCATMNYNGVSYSEFNSGSISCVDINDNFKCDRSHKNINGSCIKIIDSNNKTFSATGDHLILTKKGWVLIRELKYNDWLLESKVKHIETTYCYNLNSCITSDYQFNMDGFIFSTNSLITPHDLRKLPKILYKIMKLWANI
jgi:hypothetical protein